MTVLEHHIGLIEWRGHQSIGRVTPVHDERSMVIVRALNLIKVIVAPFKSTNVIGHVGAAAFYFFYFEN